MTAGSPGRIEKQITLRQGARHRTANRFAAVVCSVHANAVKQPVRPLNAVNHRLAAEGVGWHVLEMLGNKLLQPSRPLSLLGLVRAQSEFTGQQAQTCHHSVVLLLRFLLRGPTLPPFAQPHDWVWCLASFMTSKCF